MKNKKYLIFLIIILAIIFFVGCNNPSEDIIEIKETITTKIIVPENITVKPGEELQIEIQAVIKEDDIEKTNVISSGVDYFTTDDNIVILDENGKAKISKDAITGQSAKIIVKYKEFEENINIFVKNSLNDTIEILGNKIVVINPDAIDVVVNKERSLPADYVPKDLVKLTVPTCLSSEEVNQLRKIASDTLGNMFQEAKDEGIYLFARSGYRSYNTQKRIYNNNVNTKGLAYSQKYSAQPGHSEHQTGLAIDITCKRVNYKLSNSFGDTPEGLWVKNNCYKYGFIIRYPKGKEDITGYAYEPWHLRYVGEEFAEILYNTDLTIEEFFAQ